MFKKPIVIVLMMLYLVTVSGFALNLHYCFNRVSSIQIDAPSKGCVKGLATKEMKCCKDKHLVIKVKDAHQNGSFSFTSKVLIAELPGLQFTDLHITGSNPVQFTTAYRGPPPSPDNPIYLKNRSFRI